MERDEPPATTRLYAETEAGETVILEAVPSRRYGRRFMTVFSEALGAVSSWDRPAAYWRVMLHLLTVLDPVQWRTVSAASVARATGLSMASVERALAMLEADRVIFAQGRTAAKERRLNAEIGWCSTAEKYQRRTVDPLPEDSRGR